MRHEIGDAATRRTVALLTAIAFFRHAVFIVAILVPLFETHLGLTFREFLATEAIFAATVVLMEVPSGWLADSWRRKSVIWVGGLVAALGVWLFIPAEGFWLAALAQILIGLGISLMSGADSALLYDALSAAGVEDHYRAIEGRRHGWGMFSVAFASVTGAGMFTLDPVLPIWAMTLSCLAVSVLGALVEEPERMTVETSGKGMPRSRTIGVLVVVAAAAALFGASSVGMWLQQPYWSANHVPPIGFGILMAVGYVAGGFAGRWGHVLDRRVGAAAALGLLWWALTIAYVGGWLISGAFGIALLLLGSVAWGAGFPMVQTLINRQVSSRHRATVLSSVNFAVKLVFIPLSTAIGWLTDTYTPAAGALGLALWLFCTGTVSLALFRLTARSPAARPA